ncbi:hypothetical protein D9757_005785 [Collybiopsis confluens]|uniref:CCZ1/INTU/HSP4 first Longin domain-containing protein n=1 Tax=Collybiopsis confluens TaxID=2823264 RepID=A0A8H5HQ23_9AGAR|nr:hypothetical protein D9757_005785 [Collybiopsis confluens]
MESTRIPASLSYLTIYNPTLRPAFHTTDDEDAEEQSQILFYTSKERAISRDRMLRQVGLAKALVNFSEMFSSEDACENVHSQTRRMIMVFPEPEFCIHAGVELAKSPRSTSKASVNVFNQPKEKGARSILKGKGKDPQPTTYDHNELAVNDQASQADILRGYEEFKLRHGSFTSILSTLGQEALELQLERFFTVWAWSWNIEDGLEFGHHLGPPLHPLHRSILSILDTLANDIPEYIFPIAASSTHIIPSARYSEARFPMALSHFIQKLVPPPPEGTPPPSSITQDGTARPQQSEDSSLALQNYQSPANDSARSSFMGMNIDIAKWNWLSFGKSGQKSDGADAKETEKSVELGQTASPPHTMEEGSPHQATEANVTQRPLDDAMPSEGIPSDRFLPEVTDSEHFTTAELDRISVVSGIGLNFASSFDSPSPSPRQFMSSTIHVSEEATPLNTKKRRIFYLTRHPFLIALVGSDKSGQEMDPPISELETFSRKVDTIFDAMANVLEEESLKSSTETIPTLNKILQPKDQHLFAMGREPFSIYGDSEQFTSKSAHLFNARALLHSRHSIQEVFSRGQSPQYWHMSRKVDGVIGGEMYMQVFRKETSLADVDNALSGVIRKLEDSEGG